MEGFTILYKQMHGETKTIASSSSQNKPLTVWNRVGRKSRYWAAAAVAAGTQLFRSTF